MITSSKTKFEGITMYYFISHPHSQGLSYWKHLIFAIAIAIRLLKSVLAFIAHAVFPFIDIKPTLDLEATSKYLLEQNEWISGKEW